VLAFTPDVEAALEIFQLTHQVAAAPSGLAYMVRTGLPRAGGLGEQDAVEIEAIEWLRHVHDQLLIEVHDRQRREQAIERWRDERSEQR
jgi:hypothetical protein